MSDIPISPVPGDEPLDGRLTLGDLLASGATADVYRAHDHLLDRTVAIKLVRPDADHAARQRFDTEARALARLSHPGLATIFDIGTLRGRPCLVLHFVDGDSLADRLARGPLPLATAIDIGVTLADALAHTHERGVTHRDVRPSNILLDHDLNPHLADFGSALVGELASPEVDVHGLGLVLRECLAGDRPEVATALAEMTAHEPEQRPTAAQCHRTLLTLRAELTDNPATEQVAPAGLAALGLVDPAASASPGLIADQPTTVLAPTPARGSGRFRAPRLAVAITAVTAVVAAGVAAAMLTLPQPAGQHLPADGQHAAVNTAASAPADQVPVNYQPAQTHRDVPGTLMAAPVDSSPSAPDPAPSATTAPATGDTTSVVSTTANQPPTTTQVTTTPTTAPTSPSANSPGTDS